MREKIVISDSDRKRWSKHLTEIQVSEFGQAGSDDIGINSINAMRTTNAVLMTNHGSLVCGKDMQSTVKNAKLVEKMAKIYWGALQIGNVLEIDKKYWKKFLDYHKKIFSTI